MIEVQLRINAADNIDWNVWAKVSGAEAHAGGQSTSFDGAVADAKAAITTVATSLVSKMEIQSSAAAANQTMAEALTGGE